MPVMYKHTQGKKRYLSAATLNVRSLNQKVDLVAELFDELGLDVLCLQETWLTESSAMPTFR